MDKVYNNYRVMDLFLIFLNSSCNRERSNPLYDWEKALQYFITNVKSNNDLNKLEIDPWDLKKTSKNTDINRINVKLSKILFSLDKSWMECKEYLDNSMCCNANLFFSREFLQLMIHKFREDSIIENNDNKIKLICINQFICKRNKILQLLKKWHFAQCLDSKLIKKKKRKRNINDTCRTCNASRCEFCIRSSAIYYLELDNLIAMYLFQPINEPIIWHLNDINYFKIFNACPIHNKYCKKIVRSVSSIYRNNINYNFYNNFSKTDQIHFFCQQMLTLLNVLLNNGKTYKIYSIFSVIIEIVYHYVNSGYIVHKNIPNTIRCIFRDFANRQWLSTISDICPTQEQQYLKLLNCIYTKSINSKLSKYKNDQNMIKCRCYPRNSFCNVLRFMLTRIDSNDIFDKLWLAMDITKITDQSNTMFQRVMVFDTISDSSLLSSAWRHSIYDNFRLAMEDYNHEFKILKKLIDTYGNASLDYNHIHDMFYLFALFLARYNNLKAKKYFEQCLHYRPLNVHSRLKFAEFLFRVLQQPYDAWFNFKIAYHGYYDESSNTYHSVLYQTTMNCDQETMQLNKMENFMNFGKKLYLICGKNPKCGYNKCGKRIKKNKNSKYKSLSKHTCKGCRAIMYCNKICQKYDWNSSHRKKCIVYGMQKLSEYECKIRKQFEHRLRVIFE